MKGRVSVDLIKKEVKPKVTIINKDGGAIGNREVLGTNSEKSRLPGLGKDSSAR